jgi:hypothetical protein
LGLGPALGLGLDFICWGLGLGLDLGLDLDLALALTGVDSEGTTPLLDDVQVFFAWGFAARVAIFAVAFPFAVAFALALTPWVLSFFLADYAAQHKKNVHCTA